MKVKKNSVVHTCTALLVTTSIKPVSVQTGTLRDNRGFTLVELIVVCTIIGVLATLAITLWPKYVNQAKETRAMSEIRTIETAITGYMSDHGDRPAGLSDIKYDTLKDPWNHPYIYEAAGSRLNVATPVNTDYDLYSEGSDGTHVQSIVLSPDDIIRARDGAFVGLASNY
jgi:general secretion pathway protein G